MLTEQIIHEETFPIPPDSDLRQKRLEARAYFEKVRNDLVKKHMCQVDKKVVIDELTARATYTVRAKA